MIHYVNYGSNITIKVNITIMVKQAISVIFWWIFEVFPRALLRSGTKIGIAPVDVVVHAGLGWGPVSMRLAPCCWICRIPFLPGCLWRRLFAGTLLLLDGSYRGSCCLGTLRLVLGRAG